MRILVVEDEKTLNEMITKTLTHEGYSVDSCYNGEEALDYLHMGEFDAVVMDIDTLKTIRAKKIRYL